MKTRFLMNLICLIAFIALVTNHHANAQRGKDSTTYKGKGADAGKYYTTIDDYKAMLQKISAMPLDKSKINLKIKQPSVDTVVITDKNTNGTVKYIIGKEKVSLKRESFFNIRFCCYDFNGVKSVTAVGGYNDGLPGQLMLQSATLPGNKDKNGNYIRDFSAAYTCNTYSDKPNYKYQTGSFLLTIENANGEKSYHKIDFSLY